MDIRDFRRLAGLGGGSWSLAENRTSESEEPIAISEKRAMDKFDRPAQVKDEVHRRGGFMRSASLPDKVPSRFQRKSQDLAVGSIPDPLRARQAAFDLADKDVEKSPPEFKDKVRVNGRKSAILTNRDSTTLAKNYQKFLDGKK